MADKTNIEWADATPMLDRGGRRVRYYQRKDTSRPGQQLRRTMLACGLKWCRDCKQWLPVSDVTKNGLCRDHERAAYRNMYAGKAGEAIAARIHARKRKVKPMPQIARDYLMEQFDGICVYCDQPATTWDHIVSVSAGGETVPGNMVPACTSCNSSKKDRPVEVMNPDHRVIDVMILAVM